MTLFGHNGQGIEAEAQGRGFTDRADFFPSPQGLGEVPASLHRLKIAIVHYWFINGLGAERVTRVLARMFPQADIFTLLANYDAMPADLKTHTVTTSFLQHIPGSRRWHRHLLPLYPVALEQFDLSSYDLVLSAEAGPAKGVITAPRTCHICFCHSPMRYLWDMYHAYCAETGLGRLRRLVFSLSSHYVRLWDLASAQRVDYYIAISNHVAARIQKYYGREAKVIYPPLRVDGYISEETDDYYLVVSRLVDYKRVDLAIEACNRLKRNLRIVGDGEQYNNLKKIAGPTIKFLGFVGDEQLRFEFARCRALIFPGEEDLGATPVEAQSFGRPVIGYARGGVLETVNGVRPGERVKRSHGGVFFDRPDPESLMDAILAFEDAEGEFCRHAIRDGVLWFGEPRFRQEMYTYIEQKYHEFLNMGSPASHRITSKLGAAQ
jgi:glycosyltransferase involved in cell wall biosynthesis